MGCVPFGPYVIVGQRDCLTRPQYLRHCSDVVCIIAKLMYWDVYNMNIILKCESNSVSICYLSRFNSCVDLD